MDTRHGSTPITGSTRGPGHRAVSLPQGGRLVVRPTSRAMSTACSRCTPSCRSRICTIGSSVSFARRRIISTIGSDDRP